MTVSLWVRAKAGKGKLPPLAKLLPPEPGAAQKPQTRGQMASALKVLSEQYGLPLIVTKGKKGTRAKKV